MSATDELRRMLDERGVEWEAFDDFEPTTQWSTHNGAFVYWARERDGKLLVETTAPFKCSISCTPERAIEACTPEQAIAATLGREPDDAAMAKLHDQMNAAMLKYEMAQGIEKRDEDGAIVVPWVLKMHALLEEAATLGSCNCSNSERTNEPCLPHFWTHDGTLHIEATRMPTRIVVCEGGTCEFVPKRELDASEAENAKLRELAARAYKTARMMCEAWDGPCQSNSDVPSWRVPCPTDERDEQCVFGQLERDMRELGVEVDE